MEQLAAPYQQPSNLSISASKASSKNKAGFPKKAGQTLPYGSWSRNLVENLD